jgi:RNA:NAD 2'-phosphotransferase (TPT1/KptA family)
MIYPVVLYGCTTWFLILRAENRVLRKIYESKREKVAEELGRLHNKKLYNLYCSQNIVLVIKSRIMRRAGHVARMGEKKIYMIQMFKWWDGTWTGLIWLRIGTGGGLL